MVNNNYPLTVYKASAGSGKTFTLAIEYITLVVNNPNAYRRILAVTFTNKATEEMKKRIISQLYGIWHNLDDSKDYTTRLMQALPQYSHEEIMMRAGQALTNLLHNYNYFRVETIDSFFQQVLRNLARELDLAANLRVSLSDNETEAQAVDMMIENLTDTDAVLQWLIDYITENISDDKTWNVIGGIKDFGRNVFKDFYKQNRQLLADRTANNDFFKQYIDNLKKVAESSADRMKKIAESFFDDLQGANLSVADLKGKSRGIASYFNKLCNGDFGDDIRNNTAEKHLEDPREWVTKTSPNYDYILGVVTDQLYAQLQYAEQIRSEQWKLYQSARLTLKNLYQLRLLTTIDQQISQINHDTNRFMLGDTQQMLSDLIADDDSPFVFEKIGSNLEHIMIDEFQDTSTVQWHNFIILLKECMSHIGSHNLIVGDVKQSIYRFRSGDWRLLNNIDAQFDYNDQMVHHSPLITNYRSAYNIITYNNAQFRAIANMLYNELALLIPEGADQLKRAYSDVEQQISPRKQDGPHEGLIKAWLLPNDDYEQEVLDILTQQIDNLVHIHHIPTSKIAILTRKKRHIPIITNHFMKVMPDIHFISDEAFRLDASLAVMMIVYAMQLLVTPDDILTKANLVKAYQRIIMHNEMADNELLTDIKAFDQMLPDDYVQHTSQLKNLPVYELAEQLYILFDLKQIDNQSGYMCAFYDAINNFITDHTSNIDLFLKEWQRTLCSKTIQSAEANGIRIMTIHKSKGLEFDNVLIPFCDWKLEENETIWCTPTEQPFNEIPLAAIDYSRKMMGTIYEDDYKQEHLQKMVDNLNLLYVAFTRAGNNLFIIGKRKDGRGVGPQCGQWLEATLPHVITNLGAQTNAQLMGEDDAKAPMVFSFGTLALSEEKKQEDTHNVFLQPVSNRPLSIETYQNQTEFRQSNKSRDFTATDDNEDQTGPDYIKIGNVLHNVFANIRTTADINKALAQLEQDGVLYDSTITAQRIQDMLRKRLADERVASWFDGSWQLFNECTILSVNKDTGTVEERRPDRVMTNGKEMIVVDFKFGKPKAQYNEQVKEYIQLLSNMGYQHIKGYLWFVYTNKIIEVK